MKCAQLNNRWMSCVMVAWAAVWWTDSSAKRSDVRARGMVTIAVVDDGVDMTRPELRGRSAINDDEIQDNGVDDDRNGIVDDVTGYDFLDQDAVPMPAAESGDPSHGTKMAIVALRAADSVGDGVTEERELTRVLPLRVATGGVVNTTAVVRALYYAGSRKGRLVVNLSMGTFHSIIPAGLLSALAAQPDVLFVVSAGNQGRDVEKLRASMCHAHAANMVCVAAIDKEDNLSKAPRASNFGASVDLAAFAVDVPIEDSRGKTQLDTGTSLAAAAVSGVAARVWAAAPELRSWEVAQVLCEAARSSDVLKGTVRCGVVDLVRSLRAVGSRTRIETVEALEPKRKANSSASAGLCCRLAGSRKGRTAHA